MNLVFPLILRVEVVQKFFLGDPTHAPALTHCRVVPDVAALFSGSLSCTIQVHKISLDLEEAVYPAEDDEHEQKRDSMFKRHDASSFLRADMVLRHLEQDTIRASSVHLKTLPLCAVS